ncbi:hypothetical protein GF358_03235 [Candidatus Woesearchaeota archaeon]|nr:hypothetical protein [Candidatus Woesearchaeota archaeon]
MKKIIAYIVCILFLVSFVSADLCTESDDGKDYVEAGYVKYGVIKYDDLCVLSPDADMRVEEGQYLKEYYCDDDKREHKIVDCVREGFEKCKAGRCVSSSGNVSQSSQPAAPVGPVCGNKIVESGEDCDPPTKICYKGSDIGLCSVNCKCEIKITADGSEPDEETDASDENDSEETVIEKLDEETETVESESEKTTKTVEEDSVEDKDGISTEKNRLALPKEPKKGIFRRIWNWFGNLFS